MEKFELASRKKLRFPTTKGFLSIEDLWDLSLPSLDNIAKGVNKQLKESEEESFITTRTTKDSDAELALDILKHVIKVKLEEKEITAAKAEKAQKLAHLRQLATQKAGEALSAKSLEEIQAMITELEV